MKTKLTTTLLLAIVATSGCLSQAKIDTIVKSCPEYMQENIGEIKYMPWHPFGLVLKGLTFESDGHIELYGGATEFVVYHELMHSFIFTIGNKRPEELKAFWERFVYNRNTYSLAPVILAANAVFPLIGDIPWFDTNRLNGATIPHEDMADIFAFKQTKNADIKFKEMLVEQFINGTTGPNEDGPID